MIQPMLEARSQPDVLDEREAALNRMAHEHNGLMYRVAHRILRNPQDAEEALHNAWLNLCRSERLPQIRDERSYLAQAVRREAILLFKRYRRFPAADEGAEMVLPDTRTSPEQAATGAQMQSRIDMLSAKERVVVTLWYREGLSLVEIAEALQLPEGTVRRRFMQAKANLRPAFEARQGFEARQTFEARQKSEARQPAGLEVAAGEGSAR